MYYSAMCPRCTHTISVETRSFEIAYPLDYESRIKKVFSDKCRKCGETINLKPMKVRSRRPEAELFERY
jgi:hypothetical protein